MMNKTTLIILEITWIIIAVLCFVAAVHSRVNDGGNRFYLLMGMGVIAGVMAYIRDTQRRKR